MKCPKCQTENSDTQRFCGECGMPLQISKDVGITKTLITPSRGFKKDTVIAKKYKIIKKLDEGGMGEVYKARDTKLDRNVALKFLLSDLIRDKKAKKRFIQEAKAAAALEHPNICTVYEVDEAEGQIFISMSYIEGQSLKDKLEAGALDVDEAKDIALQVAEGLKEAHEKGIVHRDIKPANIMLTKKGQAKITDFGLAKLSGGADLTKASTIMGTVAYMSPEQAKGEVVDHRSDIWSFGCMLYEMLTGERPFLKSQEHALLYSILNEDPTPISSLREDIPSHIENVVFKALEKRAGRRYQSMQSLLEDIKKAPSIAFPKAEKSIAVLPFENLSPDPEQEYFSDGLTEEIITDLSKIKSLMVISRNSAMMFKSTRKSTKTIGRELGVQYVLEGSVRKSGNNLRIIAQLIDASSDAHLWAEKYSGTLDDVFDIQEKVSRSIVDALKVELSPEEKDNLAKRPIEDIQAYEYYLKASNEITKFTADAINHAMRYLQNAVNIIGDNALLYSTLAFAYWNLVNIGVEQEDYIDKAEEFANKALSVNPESSFAYVILGFIDFFRERTLESLPRFKKALEINRDELFGLVGMLSVYEMAGRTDEGAPYGERLLQLDPLSFPANWYNGSQYFYAGDYNRALQAWHRLYELHPENPYGHFVYATILAYNKEVEKTIRIVDQCVKTNPETVFAKLCLILNYALQGKNDKALDVIDSDLRKIVRRDATYAQHLSGFLALVNERKDALQWLETAVSKGFINFPYLKNDPFLENIRGEPRFKKLMERVKNEWENFEV